MWRNYWTIPSPAPIPKTLDGNENYWEGDTQIDKLVMAGLALGNPQR